MKKKQAAPKSKSKKLHFKKRFSVKTLVLFMLAFGGLGGYFLYTTYAATSCSTSNICVVYRKHFAAASDHFLTIDDAEAGNYSLDGPAFYAQSAGANGASKVYRLWNDNNSAHIYTLDNNYKNNLVAVGWKDETDRYSPAFYAFSSQAANTSPVYQVVNPDGSDYVYSLDMNEVNSLKAAGWSAAPAFWAYHTNPTPAAPTNASAPTGAVSHYGCDYISGWSADADNYNAQNQVHIYVDNVLYAYGVTNQPAQINVPGSNHGFWWNLPSTPTSLKAPGQHTVVVWGIDYNTAGQYTGGAKNAIIGQGTYSCASSTPAPNPTPTPTPVTITNKSAPVGYIDQMSCGQLNGWAYDPDTNPATSKSNDVHVIIGNETFNLGPTTSASPDINAAYSISGNHRFIFTIPTKYQTLDSPIQVYSIDFDSAGNYVPNSTKSVRILNDVLRCAPKSATPTAPVVAANTKTAVGTVELADCTTVRGWSYDDDNKAKPTDIHIGINTQVINTGPTVLYRKDANDAYQLSGNHGFSYTIPDSIKATAQNSYDVKVYAINIDANGIPGGVNTMIWSGKYTCNDSGAKVGTTVSSTTTPKGTENKLPPIGRIDSTGCSVLSGWARDPDTESAIKIHVTIDGGKPTEFVANINRGDVGVHAFAIDLGATYKDGKRHYADVYGLDYDNAGNYVGLNNSHIGSASWACDQGGTSVAPSGDLADGRCPAVGPELGVGASGDEVAVVQNCLKKLGFQLTADGKFGPITQNSLKIFQADYGRVLSCFIHNTFDYNQVVTGRADETTYKLLNAADSVNWRVASATNSAVLDGRSSCDSAGKILSSPTSGKVATGSQPKPVPGGGVTDTRTDVAVPDPNSGLSEKNACVVESYRTINPLGPRLYFNLTGGTDKAESSESYYACLDKSTALQAEYNQYFTDHSPGATLSSVHPEKYLARYIYWGDSIIWRLNTAQSDRLYDKLAAEASASAIENEKHSCIFWMVRTYQDSGYNYVPKDIGNFTKKECTDIAQSTVVNFSMAIGGGDSGQLRIIYEVIATINGKPYAVLELRSENDKMSHVDWNGGNDVPNGAQVRDFIP